MYKGQELVNLAEKQLGTRGAEAKKYCGLPSGANYCDALVTWLFYKEGVKDLFCNGSKQVYCPTSMDICYKKLANIPIYIALPGDVIFFDWEPNGLPNHIGIVRQRVSDLEIDTVEGNTSGYGTTGVVANKTRTYYIKGTKKVQIAAVFRPHFSVDKAAYDVSKPLAVDGLFGFNTIALTQKVLGITVDAILDQGTVKALQKIAGTPADGSWGPNTTKAIQKMVGTKVDGFFGPASCRAYQQWLNKHADFTPTPEKPKTYTGEFPNIGEGSLHMGDSGDEVKKLQKFLNWYYGANVLAVDGIFGNQTALILRKFQDDNHLAVDGYCGPATLAKMKVVCPRQG